MRVMAEKLRREFSFRDLVFFNITAVITLRWISLAAARGPFTIVIWIFAFLVFFLPLAYVVIDFTRKMPKQGGLYQWTKSSFGPFHGFVCAWCYVVNNLFYYPSLLVAISGYAVFAIAPDNPSLQDNILYVTLFSLGAFWLILFLHLIGMRFGKWVENIGGLSIWIPGMLVILLGLIRYSRSGSAANFSGESIWPNFRTLQTWTTWQTLCFGFSGIELASTMSEEVKDPEKNIPRSIYISGIAIVSIYILGTIAVMISVSSSKINLVTGIMQAISEVLNTVGLGFLSPGVALLLTFGGLGTLGAWIAGPARLPYSLGVDRYFPAPLAKIHPRWSTPYISLLWIGLLSTIILLMNSLGGASVKELYLQLTNATIIVYFIPYLYLFAAHLWNNWNSERKPVPMILAVAGFMATLAAVILSGYPPPDDPKRLLYFLKVVGGSFSFVVLSMFFYWRAIRKARGSRSES
jgi:glutamate:GABA antiporter